MKRSGFYRFFILAAMVTVFFFPLGCGGNDQVEIRLPAPEPFRGTVYIGGSVTMPGYYAVKEGDTLTSLLRAAGGTTLDADTSQISLHIPSVNKRYTSQKIDLNRADAWLLEGLPGIGKVTAARIVEYRQRAGLFRSVADLRRVEGIGETTLSEIQDLVTVSE